MQQQQKALKSTCTAALTRCCAVLFGARRWTVTDTNLSPDGKFMIYTSMSHLVHLANVTGEYDYQEPLNIAAPTGRHSGGNFGVLSACFLGSDAHTIVAGTNAHSLHVYDVERKQLLTHVPDAHANDINSVCFADPTSQVSSAVILL
jgi:DDB1- and CUL4-associated factor 11